MCHNIESPRTFRTATLFGVLLAAALLPTVAQAQTIEISPFLGTRFGGEFRDQAFDIFFDLEVDDGASAGLTVGFNLNPNSQIELLWSRQDTELLEDEGFFSDPFPLFDLKVDYYHVGYLYQWRPGNLQPYIVGSIGATSFQPEPRGLSNETFFSAGLGGGVKVMLTDHFGLRLEGRGFYTFLDDDDDFFCDDDFYRCSGYDDEHVVQGEARVGLIFAF